MEVSVPSFLDVPEKLLPLITRFNEFRYFLVEGGRASGKTQTIARILLYLAEKHRVRIVCGREILKTIDESVHTVLKDLIIENDLNFIVHNNRIVHRKSGSAFWFKGFREQGSVSIKGLEGTQVLWIDEAQAITKPTLDIIIPTIRKENSKVFFSMNRHLDNDPVYKEFIKRSDCLHIKINYNENKHCPEVSKKEARLCDPIDYNHIWEGDPLPQAENQLISRDDVKDAYKFKVSNLTGGKVLAIDPARYGGCETALTEFVRGNEGLKQTWRSARKGINPMETVGRAVQWAENTDKAEIIAIDVVGMGGPMADRLIEVFENSTNEKLKAIAVVLYNGGSTEAIDTAKYLNRRAYDYWMLKEAIRLHQVGLIEDAIQEDQTCSVLYTYMSNGKRKILSKEEMRSKKINSPDRTDAVVMAYSVRYALSEPEYQGDSRDKKTKEFWERVKQDQEKEQERTEAWHAVEV